MAGPYSGYASLDSSGKLVPEHFSGVIQLAKISNINLKTTGSTTLYTVSGVSKIFVHEIFLLGVNITGFVTPATVRVGISPSYTEWLAATALPVGMSGNDVGVYLSKLAPGLVHRLFNSGDTMALDVTIAAAGANVTVDAYVYGQYL